MKTSTATLIKQRREQLKSIRVELKQLVAQHKSEREAVRVARVTERSEKKQVREQIGRAHV